jgi:hypothetical protein
MRRFYISEEQRDLEVRIEETTKHIRRVKPGITRNRLVERRNKMINVLHTLVDDNDQLIDKRHLSY